MRWLIWVLFGVMFLGCPLSKDSLDASTPDPDLLLDAGSDDAGVLVVPLNLQVSILGVDAGIYVLVPQQKILEVDSAKSLTVESNVEFVDDRIRLMDWTDRVVPSDDVSTPDAGLHYVMQFIEPLKSGRSYQLMIDSQSGDGLKDVQGVLHNDFELTIHVRGPVNPEKTPGLSKPKKPLKKR